jgi:hypothetical protein
MRTTHAAKYWLSGSGVKYDRWSPSAMNQPSFPSDVQSAITAERLRLLSLAFYISGAIGAVLVSFLLIHFSIFLGLSFVPATAWANGNHQHVQDAPPAILFRIAAAVLGCIILIGWTLGVLTFYAGRCVARREKRIFVLIMAGFNCIWIPYGTILGVITLIFLSSTEAERAFRPGAGAPPKDGLNT